MLLVKRSFIIIIVFITIISCEKEKATTPVKQSAFTINKNTTILNDRVHYYNEPIQFENSAKSSSSLNYTLVASIESPTVNGNKLSATSLCGFPGRTYVGFHTKGNDIAGELLSLDVSNPHEPIILQSAQSDIFDINDVSISKKAPQIWICGDALGNNGGQAYAMEFSLNSEFAHEEEDNWTRFSSAYSGNSITETVLDGESVLWLTSGSNGGLEVFRNTNINELLIDAPANNTKHFDAGRDFGVMLIGDGENHSILRVFDLKNNLNQNDIDLPYTIDHLGKNGIFIDGQMAFLALGNSGLVIVDLKSGNIVNSFKSEEGIANSVFVEKDYIYLAYGNAGLFILDIKNLDVLGNYKYDGSCNYVFVEHEMVYLANGDGDGFLILTKD